MSLKEYRQLIADRPEKLDAGDVNYRKSDSEKRCGRCLHFFERRIDQYGVCEVFRPEKDEPVEPGYVCDLFTKDGEEFPLYEGAE